MENVLFLLMVYSFLVLGQISVAEIHEKNMMTGLRYQNFTNHKGALADGTCCDSPGLNEPQCHPNQCDVDFLPCATFSYPGAKLCAAYFRTATATMFNNDSFVLENNIGNVKGQQSSNVVVFVYQFPPSDNLTVEGIANDTSSKRYTIIDYFSSVLRFHILAREVTNNCRELMANFSFDIDWMDTFYSKDLHWKPMVLKDAYSELVIDVVHQCNRYFFGPTCSVFCKPTHQYTCLNDGSKNCTAGWQGPHCDQLVPHCTSGLCQNSGNCTNIHLGYVCSCLPLYSGTNCQLSASTTPSWFMTTFKIEPLTMVSIETTPASTNGSNSDSIEAPLPTVSNMPTPTSTLKPVNTLGTKQSILISKLTTRLPSSLTATESSTTKPSLNILANIRVPTRGSTSSAPVTVAQVSEQFRTIPFSTTPKTTSATLDQGVTILYASSEPKPTVAAPHTAKNDIKTTVITSVVVAFTVAIILFGSAVYTYKRLKRQKRRRKVEPIGVQCPPLSHIESPPTRGNVL